MNLIVWRAFGNRPLRLHPQSLVAVATRGKTTGGSSTSKDFAHHKRNYISSLSVSDAFDKAASEHSAKIACVFADGSRHTFELFHKDVAAFAGGLQQLNLGKNARVAIFAPTSYEWLISKYAINRAGCVAVAMNSGAHKDELGYVLEKTETEAIIIGEKFKYMNYYDTLCQVYPELRTSGCLGGNRPLRHVVSISAEKKPGTLSFAEVQSSAATKPTAVKSEDPAVIIQSSGSTGKPKSIVLTNGNLVSVAYQTFPAMRLRSSNIVLACLPLYHSFGYMCIEANDTLNGLTTVYTSMKPKPSQILELIEREKVTTIHGTPTTYFDIMRSADFGQRDISSIENGTIGATTLHTSVIEDVARKFGFKDLMLGYGLTETAGACSYADGKHFRGYEPFPGTEFRIGEADTEDEVEVDGEGARGEVQVRGATLFVEYLNDEEKTKEAFTEDGWFRTGDMGHLNEHGLLEVCGRASDLIIKGGVNISPAEIEKALLELADVAEAQVVGVFDERFGEEICAWIKLKSGGKSTTDLISAHCGQKLAKIKVPKFIVFTEDFPRTSVGKVSKKLLRQVFEQELDLSRRIASN